MLQEIAIQQQFQSMQGRGNERRPEEDEMFRDCLTGLYNRRYAEAYLADLMLREQDHERGFVMMVADLDHFKAVNDTYGHRAGDIVLCEVADRIRDNLRACDLISRYGGEEFLIVLPDTGVVEAERTAERLRRSIVARPILIDEGREIHVTASIGVFFGQDFEPVPMAARTGTFDVEPRSAIAPIRQIFDAADAALYRAKSNGRNRGEFSAV